MRTMVAILMMVAAIFSASGNELSPAEAANLFQRFVKTQRALRTLRAEFEQTVSLPGLRSPSVSKGTFFYRAPDGVRIDYSKPAGDFFLLQGEKFYVVRRRGVPRSYSASDREARMLVALRRMMEGRSDPEGEMVSKVSREDDEYIVTLTPKNPSRELPEKIENRINAESLLLEKMTIQLPRGTSMKFRFSDWERNAKIDESLFSSP